MRQKQVLRLLADQQHRFSLERRQWVEERERLLDRIMLLADKPPLASFTFPRENGDKSDPEFVDPTQEQPMLEDLGFVKIPERGRN